MVSSWNDETSATTRPSAGKSSARAAGGERGDRRTERGDGLGVGATHVGAGGGEQAGGGDPALGETDDGYPTLGQRRQVRAPSRPHLHLLRQEAHALLPMLASDGGAPAP